MSWERIDERIGGLAAGWTIAVAACMLAGAGLASIGTAGAQTAKRPASTATHTTGGSTKAAAAYTGPSTLSGVYTAEQAGRGKDVYAGSCRSCHTPASHTGAMFKKWWVGKRLSDLYTFVATYMPKNDPGSLAPEDAADVVAYLLKMNAMPVGPAELPPDADSLKKVKIEVKRTSSK
jgi:S-disulfanyl-L-cysteine oxidoreductase SoxD